MLGICMEGKLAYSTGILYTFSPILQRNSVFFCLRFRLVAFHSFSKLAHFKLETLPN